MLRFQIKKKPSQIFLRGFFNYIVAFLPVLSPSVGIKSQKSLKVLTDIISSF